MKSVLCRLFQFVAEGLFELLHLGHGDRGHVGLAGIPGHEILVVVLGLEELLERLERRDDRRLETPSRRFSCWM